MSVIAAILPFFISIAAAADAAPAAQVTADVPGSGSVLLSLIRVLGALAIVVAVFLGGVWLFRNWQRIAVHRGQVPRLNVLEVKSLGPRHALYVVGYETQRMLIASSPAGVSLLSALPDSESAAAESPVPAAGPHPFAESLRRVLQRKP